MASSDKNTKWNGESHEAMCGALMDVLAAGTLPLATHKDLVVQSMLDRGHEFTWEGIR